MSNENKQLERGDMEIEHLRVAWKNLVLAYNTLKNQKQYDTARSVAYALAETSACLEYCMVVADAEKRVYGADASPKPIPPPARLLNETER